MTTFIIFIVLCQSVPHNERAEHPTFQIFKILSYVQLIILMIREFLQCFLSYRHYFSSLMNWFEIALITLAWIVFLLSENFDHQDQRILRAVLILFSAFEFLQIVGTLPILSISTHMVMLKRVSITFLKSIAFYSILLLSFGLCFFMLFGDSHEDGNAPNETMILPPAMDMDDIMSNESFTTAQDVPDKPEGSDFANFRYPGIAIVRVFVMLTGKLEILSIASLFCIISCIFYLHQFCFKFVAFLLSFFCVILLLFKKFSSFFSIIFLMIFDCLLCNFFCINFRFIFYINFCFTFEMNFLLQFFYALCINFLKLSILHIQLINSNFSTIGEFDATDLDLNSSVYCIIFTLFVFLVTIVLFNLLNALAVSDTAEIRKKGELIDLIQRIDVLESYEKIIFNEQSSNSWLGPKLRAFISLFPLTIPHGKIIIRASKNNEILTFKPSKIAPSISRDLESSDCAEIIDITNKSFRKLNLNEDFLSKLQKYSTMSPEIMKQINMIISERDERKNKAAQDRKMRDDIENIKIQMEIQLRLINEILSKQSND